MKRVRESNAPDDEDERHIDLVRKHLTPSETIERRQAALHLIATLQTTLAQTNSGLPTLTKTTCAIIRHLPYISDSEILSISESVISAVPVLVIATQSDGGAFAQLTEFHDTLFHLLGECAVYSDTVARALTPLLLSLLGNAIAQPSIAFFECLSRVLAAWPTLVERVAESLLPPSVLHPMLRQLCSNKNSIFRSAGVALLRLIAPSDSIRFLPDLCNDPDARVREQALVESSSYITHYSPSLPFLLPSAVFAARDDHDNVRLAAIDMLWSAAVLQPECPISLNGSAPLKLLEYVFLKISDAVTDVSPKIRTKLLILQSCEFLGLLPVASSHLILQTLNKEVITPLSQAWTSPLSSDFQQPTSHEVILIDDPLLAVSAAAGAFVHGLEDELMEVRAATIASIAALSQKSLEFAVEALPSLVDMFNDEITDIRIQTIDCLEQLGSIVYFTSSQLKIILATLQDADDKSRHATYRLLARGCIQDVAGIEMVIENLVGAALVKFSSDQELIYECLAGIGKSQSHLIEFLYEKMLHLNRNFDPRESRLDDFQYMGRMIVILNAIAANPTSAKLLPPFIASHHHYIRLLYPNLVPDLNIYAQDAVELLHNDSVAGEVDQLQQVLDLLRNHSLGTSARFKDLNQILDRSMVAVSSHLSHSTAHAPAHFLLNWLRILQLVLKLCFFAGDERRLAALSDLHQIHVELIAQYVSDSVDNRERLDTLVGCINSKSSWENIRDRWSELLPVSLEVRRIHATFLSPVNNPDSPLKFPAKFPASVEVKISLKNFISDMLDQVYIKITYPDQQVMYYQVLISNPIDILDDTPLTLSQSIIIQEMSWTEKCSLQLSIVRRLNPDPAAQTHVSQEVNELNIPISEPLSYYVWPTL